ncbi:hypothetical protein DPMN_055792 [Dreissena polymorpha]|uniref:Arrestin-like N-terminal domain-containing protein n=1 Tax=Dreissena polymorpha TaxID=45954 RepID=A0A9D4CQK7_DREPO|nr:hypothetical protein DPMN_055792 [Dreissena polymorpha]
MEVKQIKKNSTSCFISKLSDNCSRLYLTYVKDNLQDILHICSHCFPFNFILPSQLPSSFKGRHGKLRCFASLTLQNIRWFAVISNMDLNEEQDASVLMAQDVTKMPLAFIYEERFGETGPTAAFSVVPD